MSTSVRRLATAAVLLVTGTLLAWRFSVIALERAAHPGHPDGFVALEDAPVPLESLVVEPPAAPRPVPPTDLAVVANRNSICGRVYGVATGKGLHGVKVTGERIGGSRNVDATIGEDGQYQLGDLGAGNWRVGPSGTGVPRGEHTQYVSLRDGEVRDGLDFALDMGLAVSGIVTKPDGAPATGANVFAYAGYEQHYAVTDDSGRFTIPGLSDGPHTVVASKQGFGESKSVEVALNAHDVETLRLPLSREATIGGVVVDALGDPVPDGMVYAKPVPEYRSIFGFGPNTDSNGAFYLAGLRAGSYEIRACRMSATSASGSVDVDIVPLAIIELREGEHKDGVRLVLADDGVERGSVSGVVRDSKGTPLEGAQVYLSKGGFFTNTTTRADGTFSFEDVPVGNYAGHIQRDGFSLLYLKDISIPSSGHEFVLDYVGRIRGRVVDATTGKPLTHFSIAYDEQRYGDIVPGNLEFVPQYDMRGVFFMPASGRNVTRLVAVAPGYAWKAESVQVAPDSDADVEIRLDRGATLRGSVVDARGTPLPQAQVFLNETADYLDVERGAPERAAAFTGSDGSFVIESVPVATPSIAAFLPGYSPGSTPLALQAGENGPITIRLGEGLFIAGRVFYAGSPVGGAEVKLSFHRASPDPQVTGGDGAFRFDGLVPGSGEIRVSLTLDNDGTYGTLFPVELDASGPCQRDLYLAPDATAVEGRVLGLADDVREVRVSAVARLANDESHFCSVPIEGGRYVLFGLPAGPARVFAEVSRPGGDEELSVESTLDPGQTVTHDFDFSGMIRVSGTVTGWRASDRSIGMLVPGLVAPPDTAEAFGDWQERHGPVEPVYIRDDGRFFVALTEPGSYTLVVAMANAADVLEGLAFESFEAKPGDEIVLNLSL